MPLDLDDEEEQDSYISSQDRHNREYEEAWASAPEGWRKKAKEMGLAPELDATTDLDVREFNDNHVSMSIIPDMAETLDRHKDRVIEKYAPKVDVKTLQEIIEDLEEPIRLEQERLKADLLGRIAGNLIYMEREKGNILARIHALIHSIPGYARNAGFTSMRASAKACRVSPEWLRRKRDQWCILLGLEPPAESTKTEEAKGKYSVNATVNHWRHQKYKHKNK